MLGEYVERGRVSPSGPSVSGAAAITDTSGGGGHRDVGGEEVAGLLLGGVAVGLLCLGLGGWGWWRWRRRRGRGGARGRRGGGGTGGAGGKGGKEEEGGLGG